MKKFICIAVWMVLSGTEASCQVHGNISFEAGIPINEFHDHLDDIGAGIKVAVYIPFQKKSPVFFGAGIGYMLFGTSRQEINETLQVFAGNTLISEIPVKLLVETNNNFVNGHISVRVKAPLEIVQPYGEARAGFSNFYTRTKVIDHTEKRIFSSENDNVITSSTPLNSTTWHFGAEGGFIIRAGKIGIQIGAAYLIGGRAKYFDRDQISQWNVQFKGSSGSFDPDDVDPETVSIENQNAIPKKSSTDLLLINAGITFGIDGKKKGGVKKNNLKK